MFRFLFILLVALFWGCCKENACGDCIGTEEDHQLRTTGQCPDNFENDSFENDVPYIPYIPMNWENSSLSFDTVVIGSQTWMAENLRYEAENVACYDNDIENCNIFGVLYDWETAKTICPAGWHLPSDMEWSILADFAGSNVGTKLKADSKLWISGEGTDDYGFNALPGGFYRNYFEEIGETAGFWSATAGYQFGSAHFRYVKYSNDKLNIAGFWINRTMAYVRCVKD